MSCLVLVFLGAIYAALLIHQGFRANEEPSALEKLVARTVRNLSIPGSARRQTNPWKLTRENLQEAREHFLARCAICHGTDGSGITEVGRNLYPKPADLRAPRTQDLTDGEIHYIIQNGVRLTGMPAWGNPHGTSPTAPGSLILSRKGRIGGSRFIRPTTCSGLQGPRAMGAIRWVTTFRRSRLWSGTLVVSAATGQGVTTWPSRSAAISLTRREWTTSRPTTRAFNAIRRAARPRIRSKGSITIGRLAIEWV